MHIRILAHVYICVFVLWGSLAGASEQTLVVGTRQVPPFAMRDASGDWRGLTIDMWERIAVSSGWTFRYEERSLAGLLEGLQDGSLDVAAAALSITSEREELVDFSHAFFHTGLGIAVKAEQRQPWRNVLRGIFSYQFVSAVGTLVLLLLIFGVLIWWFERRSNKEQFGGGVLSGVGAGFWWSAVTMTTVGYGDKAPVTLAGRFVALIWMFTAIITISAMTAAITSALTIASLDIPILGPNDLSRVRTGTIKHTTSADYFEENGMFPELYQGLEEALHGLASGEVEAVVYDAPVLNYYVARYYPGKLLVLPEIFERQVYGIALPYNSPLRQTLNRELLELLENSEFERLASRYLSQ